jgi:hypothetical protein
METETKPQAKKEWKTPELIVLVRSKPEEAVLAGCKYYSPNQGGLASYATACYQNGSCNILCVALSFS